jgi:hypothetical protein
MGTFTLSSPDRGNPGIAFNTAFLRALTLSERKHPQLVVLPPRTLCFSNVTSFPQEHRQAISGFLP